jgi:hypothetical protein
MTDLQSQTFAKEVSSCFSAEAKTRCGSGGTPIFHFVQLVRLDKIKDRGRTLRLMWKNFLESSADDPIAVGKQTRNAFTAEKITLSLSWLSKRYGEEGNAAAADAPGLSVSEKARTGLV